MWKNAQKSKKQSIELYKNNDFVSNSVSSSCVGSVKISATGQISTKPLGSVADRHLQADLKLPALQERCANSKNKDLLRLCKQLYENDEYETAGISKGCAVEPREVKVGEPKKKVPWARYAQVLPKEYNVGKHVCNMAKHLHQEKAQTYDDKLEELNKQNVPNVPKRVKRYKHHIKKRCSDTTDDSSYDTAESHRLIACRKQHKLEQSKPEAIKKTKAIVEVENELADKTIVKDLPIVKIQEKPISKRVKKPNALSSKLKRLTLALDDWYAWTILCFLGTMAYFVYILGYDINLYVNEERRYLYKMRTSGLMLKCFYYVMRVLKVPIF